ncbi:MAG: cation:proton antiporter, partial [Candidatus Buchananbacteria bacterium]
VVILLFQVGLESNVAEMCKVGVRAFLVATIGVVVPFVIGTWIVGPWLLPGLPLTTYLFLGAALTATSVGITARVFQDLGKANTPEAKIVLGAAVIDDVMGLVVLAVVSAIVTVGTVSGLSIVWIIAKATLFLLGAIVIGQLAAPKLGEWFSKIHQGLGMKFVLAISFALVFAYLAQKIGLAPIVGAFAAGLVLDPVHFRYFWKPEISQRLETVAENEELSPDLATKLELAAAKHADQHVERLIKPVGFMLVPIFFVLTGMGVKLETLFDRSILITALAITVAAFIGKIVAGVAAGKVNRWIVGWGMVPRGEVGLIFAVTGKSMGVINDGVYSIIVIVVTLSTLLIPPILAFLLKRQK